MMSDTTLASAFDRFSEVIGRSVSVNGSHTFTKAGFDEGGAFYLSSLSRIEKGVRVWVNEGRMSAHKRLEARDILREAECAFLGLRDASQVIWPGSDDLWPFISIDIAWRQTDQRFRFFVNGVKAHHSEIERDVVIEVWYRTLIHLSKFARVGPVRAWRVVSGGDAVVVPAVDAEDALVRATVFRGFSGKPEHASANVYADVVVVLDEEVTKTREAAVRRLEGLV